MLFVNSKGQMIIRSGHAYPRDCAACPCEECGTCTTSCYYSVLHHVNADYPGVISPPAANVYHCKCTYGGETFDLYLDNTSEPISRFRDGRIWYDLDDPNPAYNPVAKFDYDDFCLKNPDDAAGQLDAYQTYLETKDKYLHYYTAEELAGQTGRWRSDTPLFAASTFSNRKHALGLYGEENRPQYYVTATLELSCKNKPEEPIFDTNGIRYAKNTEGWIISTDDCNFGPPRKAKITPVYFNIFKFTATVFSWNETYHGYELADTFVHWSQNITNKPVSLFGVDNVEVLGGADFPLSCVGVSENNVPDWMDPDWHWSDHVNPDTAIETPDFFQIYNFVEQNSVKKYSYFRHAGDYAYNSSEHTIALTDFDADTAGVCYMGNTTCENPECDTDILFIKPRIPKTDSDQHDPALSSSDDISVIRFEISGGSGGSENTGGNGTGGGGSGGSAEGGGGKPIDIDIILDPGGGKPLIIIGGKVTVTPSSGGAGSTIGGNLSVSGIGGGSGTSGTASGGTVSNGSGGTTTTITVPNQDGTTTTITINLTPDPDGKSSSGTATINDGHGHEETIPIKVTPGSPWWKEKVPIETDLCLRGEGDVYIEITYSYTESDNHPDYPSSYSYGYHVIGSASLYNGGLPESNSGLLTYSVDDQGNENLLPGYYGMFLSYTSQDCTTWDTYDIGYFDDWGYGHRLNIALDSGNPIALSVPKGQNKLAIGTYQTSQSYSYQSEEFYGEGTIMVTHTYSYTLKCVVKKLTDLDFE